VSISSAPVSHRPFRFAVQAYRVPAIAEWRDLARKVEDLGYGTLFSADHVLDRGISPQHLAPIASLAAAAAVTETLRVGARVFNVDFHVPAVLAKELATLDQVSDGRLELGVGAGYNAAEYQAMGLAFHEGPRRLAKLKEVVAFLKAHFGGKEIDCRGEFVNVTGYAGLPLPVQRPHPPIMIGGNRKAILSFAAREAQIVSFQNVSIQPTPDGLTPQQEIAQQYSYVRDAAGGRLGDLDIESSPYFSAVTDRPEEQLARLAANFGVEIERLLDHPNVMIGPEKVIEERLIAGREHHGVNFITVQQDMIDDFAPIAARLTGK
jgi:probable F420-dependent oxidoreductase